MLMFTVRVKMRMGVDYIAVPVAVSMHQVGAQQQFLVREDVMR